MKWLRCLKPCRWNLCFFFFLSFFLSTGCFALAINQGEVSMLRSAVVLPRRAGGRWLVNQTDLWVCFAPLLSSSSGPPLFFLFVCLFFHLAFYIFQEVSCVPLQAYTSYAFAAVYMSKTVELRRSDSSSEPQRSTRKDFHKLVRVCGCVCPPGCLAERACVFARARKKSPRINACSDVIGRRGNKSLDLKFVSSKRRLLPGFFWDVGAQQEAGSWQRRVSTRDAHTPTIVINNWILIKSVCFLLLLLPFDVGSSLAVWSSRHPVVLLHPSRLSQLFVTHGALRAGNIFGSKPRRSWLLPSCLAIRSIEINCGFFCCFFFNLFQPSNL